MKSPYFQEEHETFRDAVRRFVEKEIVPHADEWEAEERIPREIWLKMGREGYLGINFPEKFGGSEADFFFSVAFLEELTRSQMGGFTAAVSVHEYMAMQYIYKFGSEELKQNYLVPGIAGEKIGALAVTEPNAGSDVAAIRTRAIREGDHYLLNGAKTFITNGVYGDYVVVAAKTDPDAGADGISLFIVDQGTSGFTATKLRKMGWHCSDTAELTFEDVRIPASQRIGEENMGFYYIMDAFQLERLVAAIIAEAGAYLTLQLTLQYINERQAFGRPISRFQAIRHRLADLATEVEAARQLTYHTAYLYSQQQQAVRECSMAKLYASEVAKRVVDECLQFFGGYGYMEEYLISRVYRDTRVGTIVGGTSEIMREIISRILIDQVEYEPLDKKLSRKAPSPPEPSGTESAPKTETRAEKTSCPETAREIIASLPRRFRPEKAGDYQTVFHFDISGEQGGQFTVIIEKGTCRVEEGLHGEPRCVLKAKDTVYADIELGRMNPQMALVTRKIKVSNLPEMMQFIKMFRRVTEL